MKQRTIGKEVTYSGIGLHTGNESSLTFKPASANSGIVFVRVDLDGSPTIPADVDYVVGVERGTTLASGNAKVLTVEHVLAAVEALRIDNLVIELDTSEPPVGDGSSLPFYESLAEAGMVELDAEKEVFILDKPFHYNENEIEFLILPSDNFKVSFHVDYDHPLIGHQYVSVVINEENFKSELAPARTFGFSHELAELRKAGLIRGGSLKNAVVIGDNEIMNEEPLRYPNEFVRHKILDLIGDLSLLGREIRGHVISSKSGHTSNINLVRRLRALIHKEETQPPPKHGIPLDVEQVMDILPHRFPFIMVDKILELEEAKRAVGIKNVTINEPFFLGHFPGHPIMPGVLIIEAMGQVGGLLLMNSVPDRENKVMYFSTLDKIKFRKPVRPGDQLRMELKMVKFRGRTCKMVGRALVDGELVAEAEMMAVVVDR